VPECASGRKPKRTKAAFGNAGSLFAHPAADGYDFIIFLQVTFAPLDLR